MAVVAPIPSASEITAAAVNEGLRGVPEVVGDVPKPACQPDVADLLADLGKAADLQDGSPLRVRLRET